jgi:hypothetical protein
MVRIEHGSFYVLNLFANNSQLLPLFKKISTSIMTAKNLKVRAEPSLETLQIYLQ